MLRRLSLVFCVAFLGALAWSACGDDGGDTDNGAAGSGGGGGEATGGSGGAGGTGGGSGGTDSPGGSGGDEQPSASCREEATAFTACGGDLSGTWALADVCLEVPLEIDECPAFSGDVSVSYGSGYTISFVEGELTLPAVVRTMNLDASMPLSCALELEEGIETCEDLSGPESGECSGETTCTCQGSEVEEILAGTSSYTVGGEGEVRIDDAWYEYCVEGERLYLMGNGLGEEEADSFLYVFERQ